MKHDFDFSDEQKVTADFSDQPKSPNLLVEFKKPIDDVITPGSFDIRNEDINCKDDCKYIDDPIDVNYVEEIRDFSLAGFRLMDKGIKNYLSGIRIPVYKGTEEYRIMAVRISGADQDSLIYTDKHLLGGRLALPILSITRNSEAFDPKRYSSPLLPFFRRYINDGCKVQLFYRPAPYLLDYTLDILAEHKNDAENALFSIASRFNPIASYLLEDDKYNIKMEVILKYNGSTNNSDLDADSETHADVKYSISIQMEGWLPLPSKVIPTILSKPVLIEEAIAGRGNNVVVPGDVLGIIRDQMK